MATQAQRKLAAAHRQHYHDPSCRTVIEKYRDFSCELGR
jgi:hypothetical protein